MRSIVGVEVVSAVKCYGTRQPVKIEHETVVYETIVYLNVLLIQTNSVRLNVTPSAIKKRLKLPFALGYIVYDSSGMNVYGIF